MLNKVFIQGNLVKDPDYRETPNGQPVCSLRLASSRKFKTSSGQMQEKTTFVKIKTFGTLAKTCRQFLSKGSPVIFEGKLELEEWQSKDGQHRQELVVNAENLEFLPSRGEQRENPPRQPQNDYHHNTYSAPPIDRSQYAPPPPPPPPEDYSEVPEDDIPF